MGHAVAQVHAEAGVDDRPVTPETPALLVMVLGAAINGGVAVYFALQGSWGGVIWNGLITLAIIILACWHRRLIKRFINDEIDNKHFGDLKDEQD